MRYAVVIEKAQQNYSAYVPDLPGCIATGATVAEAQQSIREAIELHLSAMREVIAAGRSTRSLALTPKTEVRTEN